MSVRESEIYEKKYRLIAVNNGVKAYNEKISINDRHFFIDSSGSTKRIG